MQKAKHLTRRLGDEYMQAILDDINITVIYGI